jgi:transcriptional regulator with XRE-family HTH domain
MSHHTTSLADTLRQRMQELGLDQRQLAQRAGVSAATLRELQQGTTGNQLPSTLAKISRALDWPSDALIRLVSALPDEPAATVVTPTDGAKRTYDPPSITPTRALQRLVELEDELRELRAQVTQAVIDDR